MKSAMKIVDTKIYKFNYILYIRSAHLVIFNLPFNFNYTQLVQTVYILETIILIY